ncbi:hypothetical protein FPOAC2_02046 [Fusarium poae]
MISSSYASLKIRGRTEKRHNDFSQSAIEATNGKSSLRQFRPRCGTVDWLNLTSAEEKALFQLWNHWVRGIRTRSRRELTMLERAFVQDLAPLWTTFSFVQ